MGNKIQKIFPEDLYLSVLPDFVPDEAARWQGRIDPRRPGRYATGFEAMDALVDALHSRGYQTSEQCGAQMGVEGCYLNGFIRIVSGLSFAEWRDHYLLLMACELLDKTKTDVQDIARRVGFASSTAFSRWFQKQTGRQPVEWRNGFRTGARHRRVR